MEFDFSSLITDRSQADVDAFYALLKKPLDQWTEEEASAFWGGGYKGNYDFTDVNRVIGCMDYLVQRLADAGCGVEYLAMDTFDRDGHPPQTVLKTYRANVAALRAALAVPESAPEALVDMDGLTLTEANNIEKILLAVEDTINRMERTIDLGWAMGIAHIGLYGSV